MAKNENDEDIRQAFKQFANQAIDLDNNGMYVQGGMVVPPDLADEINKIIANGGSISKLFNMFPQPPTRKEFEDKIKDFCDALSEEEQALIYKYLNASGLDLSKADKINQRGKVPTKRMIV